MTLLLVLQVNYESAALASRVDTLDNEHLVLGIFDSLLQVVERTHGLVVDRLDDEALGYAGILHLAAVDLQHLKAVRYLKLFLLRVGDRTNVNAQHVDVGILHHLGVALFVLQCQRDTLLLLVAQVLHNDLIAWTLLGDDTLQVAELLHLLAVHVGDDVTLLDACVGGSTVINNLGNVDTLHCAEVLNLLVLILL